MAQLSKNKPNASVKLGGTFIRLSLLLLLTFFFVRNLARNGVLVLSNSDGTLSWPKSWVAENKVDKKRNHYDRFATAATESFGFFTDIDDVHWSMLKHRVRKLQPNFCSYCLGGQRPAAWFQNHYEPEFTCPHEQRMGRLGEGGKWVCDPHRLRNTSCLVYSVGSNGEFSFEQDIKTSIGKHCEIHTFDPANYTARAGQVMGTGADGVQFHQWGIDAEGHHNHRGEIFKTLNETITELGHEGRKIDIFKVDCEGCELKAANTWMFQPIQQILIEIHAEHTKIRPGTKEFFESMYANGYVIFHKEINIRYWKFGPAVEYGYVKLGPDFFRNSSYQD